MPVIYLFDIDSVLVEPRGYRAAVFAALRYFTHRLGLDDSLLPDEATLELYEAHRLTSEWDMVPISLAILLNGLKQKDPSLKLPQDLQHLFPLELRAAAPEIDYRSPITRLAAMLRQGRYPADILLDALRKGQPSSQGSGMLLPGIADHPLAEQLLAGSRSTMKSLTTRIFQQLALGSAVFEAVYGLKPELDSSSLLKTLDQPLLSPTITRELLRLWQAGALFIAAYTMRPSLPPKELPEQLRDYSPEAELALEASGLKDIPLIGYGRVLFLAQQRNVEAEALLKPSPFQALAAILAAATQSELASLELAFQLTHASATMRPNPTTLKRVLGCDDQPLQIHIFEDSVGGIEAVQRAGEILMAQGIPLQITAWGIATNSDKVLALKNVGAAIFAHTEEALTEALSRLNR